MDLNEAVLQSLQELTDGEPTAHRAIQELADADPMFALELAVSPRAALRRLAGLFGDRVISEYVERLRRPASQFGFGTDPAYDDNLSELAPATAMPPQSVPQFGTSHTLGFGPEGSPPTPLTQSPGATLTLTNDSNVMFSAWLPLPSGHPLSFAFGEGDLDTYFVPLERHWGSPWSINPVGVQFNTSSLPFGLPAEAQLYARDPEELGQFADTLETSPSDVASQVVTLRKPWLLPPYESEGPFQQTERGAIANALVASGRPITLPNALALLSPATEESVTFGKLTPPVLHPAVNEAVVKPVLPSDFFGHDVPVWTGDPNLDFSGEPSGFGSVKAARVNYPGLCTLELPFERPVPNLTNTQGYASIFEMLEQAIKRELLFLTLHFDDIKVYGVTAFPLLRHSPRHWMDSRGQFFVNIELEAWSWFGSCRVEASVLYDIKLDARGGVVLEVARLPEREPANPHPPSQGSWYTQLEPPSPWSWTDAQGNTTSGLAAIAIRDYGGRLCGSEDPIWNIQGFDDWVTWILGTFVPWRVNSALREIQMFPRPWFRPALASNLWACNAALAIDDPQGNLFRPRHVYDDNFPVFAQTDLGMGLSTCANARHDLCRSIRLGFGAADCGPPFGMCCQTSTSDDPRLVRLLAAVNRADAWGNLAYWGCEETDTGNASCLSPTNTQLIGQPGQCPPLNFNNPSQLQPGRCLDRQAGDPRAHAFNGGCEPDVTMGSCFFAPPAKRLIVNPDGIQLVFYDSASEWDNPAFALRVALNGYAIRGLPLPTGGSFPNPAVYADPSGGLQADQLAFLPYDAAPSGPQGPDPQGMWSGAWQPPGQPLALCNYDRFNDLEPRPVKVSVVDQKTVVPADFDPYGHYWRPFTFPRPYAVYTGPPRSDTRLWHP